MRLLEIQFPFQEPVLIITLVLIILLIGPVFFERIRIPSIVGLLISGAIIGPNGFNLVSPDLEFTLLGTMGLLYLMFLAGLEIDLVGFIENKFKSISIGLATFVIPFIVGFIFCRFLLNYAVTASLLIAAMLSSHTLISYPLLGKLGIVNKPVVTIVVGATIIADILALIAMEIITDISDKGFRLDGVFMLAFHFLILFLVCFFIFPRLSRAFLNRYQGDLGVQYVFVLVILFSSSLIAHLLDIEPIIGAFFSGLILNRLIINSSPLYKRIEFIGNNLFIPFFLISIGILADFSLYFNQPLEILFLLVLIFAAFSGKYIAAIFSGLFFKTSRVETNLIFGLSVSRAASAIAIILIGFNMGVISEAILNNTVILILISSISSSYITHTSGKKLILSQDNEEEELKIKQKILVPLANPETMKHLLEFATFIQREENKIPIYALTVFTHKNQIRNRIQKKENEIGRIIKSLHSDCNFEISSRLDNSITNGIIRAADEFVATAIIVGWNETKNPFNILFGNLLKNLLNKTERMIIVLKTPSSFRRVKKIHMFCPEGAQFEKGFHLWLDSFVYLVKKFQLKTDIHCNSGQTLDAIQKYTKKTGTLKYFEFQQNLADTQISLKIKNSPEDLLIFVHSRKKAISHKKSFENNMNKAMATHNNNNVVLFYPEQYQSSP